ncbi:MAG: hypothetical protein ACYDCO_04935 [Armatimonadota bacterium]
MNIIRIFGLACLLAPACLAVAQTVVINGKAVPIGTLVQKGKPMVDALALLKALGITAAWDAKTQKLVIVTAEGKGPGSGAVQMPGEWGAFGVSYQLGDAEPIVFSLLSAEYTVARVPFGDTTIVPAANEKLLVLRYTLQNMLPKDTYVGFSTLHFVAVDIGNENREYVGIVGVEENKSKLDLYLKQSQKVQLYTVIKVPAAGVVPKLIVQPPDGKVLRFDLRGKAKPLPPPIADPTDAAGASAREQVPAPVGQYYPMGQLDVQFVSAAYTRRPIGEMAPGDGKRFLLVTVKLRNGAPVEIPIDWQLLNVTLETAAERSLEWSGMLLHEKLDEAIDLELKPGEEATLRTFVELPEDDAGVRLHFQEKDNSRTYLFDVRNVK